MFAVVMAGGAGTRFWPLSRKNRPKQLLPLWDGRTLMELTVERLRPLVPLERLLVVTGRHLAEATAKALPDLPEDNLIVEPSARNTMPCIALAASEIRRRESKACLGVFSADHFVRDEEAFRESCRLGFEAAEQGRIATLGIQPTHPETGFGYICSTPGDEPVLAVDRFVEKPDRETAERYFASGDYLWNGGMFFVRVRRLLAELATHMPETHRGLMEIAAALEDGRDAAAACAARVYPTLPRISIDYGVMEKADDVVTLRGDFGWNDVGSWSSLADYRESDDAGNVADGTIILHDAHENIIVGDSDHAIAVIGVDNLVVVQSGNAILVVPRERAQDVREAITALEEQKLERFL